MERGNGARDLRKGGVDRPYFLPGIATAKLSVMCDAEHTGAAMNILDDLRAEWIAIRKSLGGHIAYLEAGNKIHPVGSASDEATTEFLVGLKQYRSEVQGWLIHLPSERE